MLGRSQVHFDVVMQWIHILRANWWPGPTFTHRDLYPAEGRNVITAGALLREDWDDLLWVDSDHLPSPLFIERMQEYPLEAEIIIGPYFGREYPFDLQAWDSDPEAEGLRALHPSRIDAMLQKPGLYRVGGGGTGWMLIRRRVLEEMEAHKGQGQIWEIRGLTPELAEKLGVGLVLGEDVMFCIETRKLLGVQAWLDTDVRMESGHIATRAVGRRDWYAGHIIPGKVGLDVEALNRSGHRLEVEVDTDRIVEATDLNRISAARDKRERRLAARKPSPAREGEYVPDGEAIDWEALRAASERRAKAQP